MDDSSQRVDLILKPQELTAEEIKDIRKSVDQMISVGFTDNEIKKYIPEDWIPQLMEEPMDKRKQPRNPERQEQIKELLIKGKSMNRIAEELGVSIGTVQYWVKKIGPIEVKSGKKKAKGEVDGEEVMKKMHEAINKNVDYWSRFFTDREFQIKELMRTDGLSYEQAYERALAIEEMLQRDEKERNEE